MAFTLTRSSSPTQMEAHQRMGLDEPPLSSPHGTFSSTFIPSDSDMHRSHLDIVLDSPCIYLRGSGSDIQPAHLSGRVALHLTDDASIKEITLQFRGKVRLPAPSNESGSSLSYIVCNHDWSFLEGEKNHSHTLKAGRHYFPFQLQIGGSLPSSLSTNIFGGASVAYKLRAHVVRSGFSSNLQAITVIPIIRSLSAEALEYQQTLEIENTWPEKVMYSIVVPHKAWAAGDQLTALLKFSPLAKGVTVATISSSLHETTKIFTRAGSQNFTRVIPIGKHEFIGGKAVAVDFRRPPHSRAHSSSSPVSSTTPAITHSSSGTASPTRIGIGLSMARNSIPAPSPPTTSSEAESSTSSSSNPDPEWMESQDEISTHITVALPSSITPSHPLEPITVSHRIRWSIILFNLDGHSSELRCSLPLHMLDHRLLDEARSLTSATRRLVLGGSEVPPQEEEEMQLPSYTAHVRDRVANMYLSEASIMRVANPWLNSHTSPTYPTTDTHTPWSHSLSGHSTPLDAYPLSHLPPVPGSGDNGPLDYVNSELLLSLSNNAPTTPNIHPVTPDTDSDPASRQESLPPSRRPSRRSSRASSPERRGSTAHPAAGTQETQVQSGKTTRNIHDLFHGSMKNPFTSLSHHGWLSRSHSHPAANSCTSLALGHDQQHHREPSHLRTVTAPQPHGPHSALFHRAFTEVPDYSIASRGFIGGVPPLSSMQGLPSYEETERSHNEPSSSIASPADTEH